MRVMQVMAGARYGGAEAFFVRLVLALARAGLDQCVVMRRDGRRHSTLGSAGLVPMELPFGGIMDTVTGRALRREVARLRPDLVLCWMGRAARFAPSGRHVLVGRMGGYYDLKYYRHCDHLVGNTPDIVAYLVRQGWSAERAHHLPNFVDEPADTALARERLGTPEGVPLLLALGRLHENKGFDVLLQALARLPGVWLWLAGEGSERRALGALADRLGVAERVHFLGWRDDIGSLMATADVCVCPSRHEPLGNVILEAWAAGKPVVAAAAAGPQGLIEDGETGRLVPIDDAGALAASLGETIAEPERARTMGEAGHARFRRDHSEPVVVAKYLAFFHQVIELCAA